MTVKERLVKYIKHKQISNSDFCRAINVSMAYISSMRKSIQPDKLESIALNFPDLNTGWLLTGEGDMLREKPSYQPTSTPSDENISIKNLWDMITKQQEIIERQQKSIEDLTTLLSKQIVVDKDTKAEPVICAIAG